MVSSEFLRSAVLQDFLNEISRLDDAYYRLEYEGDHSHYKFIAKKMIHGEPMSYSVYVTEETLEGGHAGTVLNKLRQMALHKMKGALISGKVN